MLTRTPTLTAVLAATLVTAGAADAQTRLYSLIVNEGSLTPAEGTKSEIHTGTTVVGLSTNPGLFAADMVAISEGTSEANFGFISSGSTFTTYREFTRYAGTTGRGAIVYDFDLNDVATYNNLTLDLGMASGDGADTIDVYVSYNDADAGLSLDSDLSAAFSGDGVAILAALSDTSEYTSIASVASLPVGTNLVDGFSLDAIRDASDDGLLRVAISANGFRRDLTVLNGNGNNPGLSSQITGTLVPEPGSLALLGLGGFAMLKRRRSNA